MKEYVFHNSHDKLFREPFGAVPCGEKINLGIRINSVISVKSVLLRLWKEGWGEKIIDMKVSGKLENCCFFSAEITVPEEVGLLWYYFIIECYDKTYYYGNNTDKLGGPGEVYENPPESYQITVYKNNFKPPWWFMHTIMYQIFVDRFYNGNDDGSISDIKNDAVVHKQWDEKPFYKIDNAGGEHIGTDFFGGNLRGTIKKLWYLKELGISVIYLNPIFDSSSNHKYNTGDYMKIDPMFGDKNTLTQLCQKAGELDISVILDGVFSHTGSDSVYFNKEGKYPSIGAYQSRKSPYYSWYKFKEYPDDYDCWWNIKTLPNVNEMEPSYLDFIMNDVDSVVKHWMRTGIRGWRLDVADELPDAFLKMFRSTVKEMDKDSVIIGEVWEDASNKTSYDKKREYVLGEEFDSVMNYPLREAVLKFFLGELDGEELHRIIMSIFENYPLQCFYSLMNLVGTHDTPRIKTIMGGWKAEHTMTREEEIFTLTEEEEKLAVKRVKLIALFQMTFPGIPCIYYGDEVGMQGCSDPFNRGTYPWGNEDNNLMDWYKKTTSLRNENDMLRTGSFIPIYYDKEIYGYIRMIKDGKDVFDHKCNNGFSIVLFNRSIDNKHSISIDLSSWNVKELYDIFNNKKIKIDEGYLNIQINPLEGRIFII